VRFYTDFDDPEIPNYLNEVPLELRPLGGFAVEYFPCVEIFEGDCPGGADNPESPSMVSVFGFPIQSLFFISSSSGVDLTKGSRTSLANDAFMLDTGAQVTVVGNGVGARLGLNPNQPDFLVEIQGVDGTTVFKPGFYVDTLDIPALGEFLSFTNVPVVLIDVASPEGGSLDGIIGMNLFVQYNYVLQGGGLFGQPSPALRFERIAFAFGDADEDGDVDHSDFGRFQICLGGPDVTPADPDCLLHFDSDDDQDVDADDFATFQACMSGPGIVALPTCAQ
jgi:hypothetical protein